MATVEGVGIKGETRTLKFTPFVGCAVITHELLTKRLSLDRLAKINFRMKKRILVCLIAAFAMSIGMKAQTCKIGTVEYDSLSTALWSVPAGGTAKITMLKDCEVYYADIRGSQNITIDLNSKNIYLDNPFYVDSKSLLKIEDTGGNGTVRSDNMVIYNKGNTTLCSGRYIQGMGTFSCIGNYGKMDINDADIVTEGEYEAIFNYGELNINGGTVTHLGTGSGDAFDYRRCLWTAEGSTTKIEGGTFQDMGNSNALCFNGDATISDVNVEAEGRGAFCVGVYTNSNVNIESGEFVSHSNSYVVANYSKGNLIISGGTFTHGDDSYVADYDERIVLFSTDDTNTHIKGGTFIGEDDSPTLFVRGNCTIDDITVENSGSYYCLYTYRDAKVTINGGDFTSSGRHIICHSSTKPLVINDGSFSNPVSHGIYVSSGTSAYINGGDFSYAGVIGTYGDLYIRGGSFDGKSSDGTITTSSTGHAYLFGGQFYNQKGYPIKGSTIAFGGLYSHISSGYEERYVGNRLDNEDAETKIKYRYLIKPLPSKDLGKVWLRNVKTGKYLSVGDGGMWLTQALTKEDGLCLDMLDVADGAYISFVTKFARSYTCLLQDDGIYFGQYGILGYSDKDSDGTYNLFADRIHNQGLFIKKEIRPGVYSLKLEKRGFIGDKDGIVFNRYESDADECTHWEFVTYDDIKSSLYDADIDNGVDATKFISNPDLLIYLQRSSVNDSLTADLLQPWTGLSLYTYTDSKNYQWSYASVTAKKFNTSQTITDLPNGFYKVSCQGFYRNASTAGLAANKHNNGTERLNVMFYANDREVPLKSIADGATSTKLAPNSVKTTCGYLPVTGNDPSIYFENGLYDNSIIVQVTDGTLTIGVKQQNSVVSGEWTAFDHFRLTYYGNYNMSYDDFVTGVVSTSDIAPQPVSFYDTFGTMHKSPTKGINIVRMTDGTTRKVMVK